MNKQKFNRIVRDRAVMADKDLVDLVELSEDYPYSQVIHSLIAKASRDRKISSANSRLTLAAIYVADRKVLKLLIDNKLPAVSKDNKETPDQKTRTTSKRATVKKKGSASPAKAKSERKKTEPQKEKASAKPLTPAKSQTSAKKSTERKKAPLHSKPAPKTTAKPVSKPARKPASPAKKKEGYDITPVKKDKLIEISQPEKAVSDLVLESLEELKKARSQYLSQWDDDQKPEKKEEKTATTKKKSTQTTKKGTTGTKTKAKTKAKSKTKSKSKSKAGGKKSAASKKEAASSTTSTAKKSSTSQQKTGTRKGAAKSTTSKSTTKGKTKTDTSTSKKKAPAKKKTQVSEGASNEKFLKEIKKSHKKQKGRGSKLKEQIDLINRFIKEEPKIGKPENAKDKDEAPKNNLAEGSTELSENLVSENLAKIFIRQQQYGKAIEIYRKLIWKFPQKKSYFADQIEELKKK